MNLAEEDSLTFKAAVILICCYDIQSFEIHRIKWITRYNYDTIKTVLGNLIQNKIIVDDKLYVDWFDEETGWMDFILTAMCGAGDIVRYEVPVKEIELDITEVEAIQLKTAEVLRNINQRWQQIAT